MNPTSSERLYSSPGSGLAFLFLGFLTLAAGITLLVIGGPFRLLGVLFLPAAMLLFRGLTVVPPNHSKLVILFGKYTGPPCARTASSGSTRSPTAAR